jgi:hypothetical protein
VIEWLLTAALGPATVALPLGWGADALAGAARRWFKRIRRADGLSRLVRDATGSSADLTDAEFAAVRELLERQQTWDLLGQGPIDGVISWIAACLPERDGRTAGRSRETALVIARGLLEFAAVDLDPGDFQRILLARLQRLGTDQLNALDEAMFVLHADLIAGLSA